MHIEPGLVAGSKLLLGYATSAVAVLAVSKLALAEARTQGAVPLLARAGMASALVLVFFEVLPHFPVGVSEVHFIMGSTLYLLLGAAAAGTGLAAGLLIQGLLFQPQDLAQYGMNVTTLLMPLLAIDAVARRIIAKDTAYVDLRYSQALALSTTFQAGVVSWVVFWALLGHGVEADNLASIVTFAGAYATVLLIEPVVDLVALAAAKALGSRATSNLVAFRLLHTEAVPPAS